jgi:CDP-2,3-bis-(O-geranylgeranyl)-sn-glycerol synthase
MEAWLLILQSFWFIAPAYAANAFPPLVHGKTPIDMGRSFLGKRILGDGKTIQGSIAGISFGLFIGAMQILGQGALPPELQLMEMTLPIVLLLSLGAIIGDIIGSFIKRRLNVERGAPVPLLDQLDFLIMALMLGALAVSLSWVTVIILVALTPPIHWIANNIGYLIKVKKQPW